MPADPTPDLAALDALYQAATAHRKAQSALMDLARRGTRADEWERTRNVVDDAAARVFAALDALDLPSLRRELEIGRAAVEVIDTVEALCEAWDANGFSAKCLVKDSPAWRLYQARAQLRALRETPDA